MKFNFDWNCVAAGAPYITISELALGFNLPSISLLGNPEEVVVGFDEKTMTIGVKQYDGTENVKSYKFYSRMKNGWIRIGCKDFVKYLSTLTGLKFSQRFVMLLSLIRKIGFCIFLYWMRLRTGKIRRWMKIIKRIIVKQKAHH